MNITNVELFNLQLELASRIAKIEKSVSYFKKTANRKNQNNAWFSREVYKAQRWVYKLIMDGIAWRFLNFDRASLRQIAEHHQTGNLNPGFENEILRASYIVSNSDHFVILNDLTNIFRFGDLTIASKDKIYIDEVKTKGKATSDQKKSLKALLENLNKKQFRIGQSTADFLLVEGTPENFLTEVEKILKEAKFNTIGAASKRLCPYLWVTCLYSHSFLKAGKEFKKIETFLPKNPFTSEKVGSFIPMNNLFMFGEFTPNFVPYTAYPFQEELIADLIFGRCILSSHLSQMHLEKSIKGKGWSVIFPTRQKIVESYDSIKKPEDIKKVVWDPQYHAKFSKGAFYIRIPREEIFRINTEFLSIKAIIRSLDTARKYLGVNNKYYVTGFKEECKMWV